MLQTYEQLLDFIERGEPCALATLVSTSGSSPQNTGAQALFLPDGRIVGTIGGGCMEAEARRIALECLRHEKPRLFELRLDDDFGWGDGLICGGQVQIFIDPAPHRWAEAYRSALDAAARREKVALCTLLQTPSAASELVGHTVLVPRVSGESAREEMPLPFPVPALAAILETGKGKRVEAEGVSIYVEPITPRPVALIAGAGHIGASLAQVLTLCGFEVVVVDDRPSFANLERLPFADRVVVDEIPRFIRSFPIQSDTYVIIVTRGHRNDARVLRECIHSSAKYIGMIGSKRKVCVIFEELLREGLATKEELRRVHSPMGLTLGDREVGEIAVSIAAELIAVRNGADLSALRPMGYTPPFLADDKVTR
jgi:xanthine dehydrogenase accessory factor